MSAIAGHIAFVPAPATAGPLAGMLDRLATFRHADARGQWRDGPAALGHLLERLTPEDAFERQPLFSPDKRYVLSADLRLDNRGELADKLDIDPADTAALPDSAFVLAAYRQWGEDCPDHLLGDFAFALWDRQAQQLFCARDHMGVRPFYYVQTPQCFAFASAIKALLAIPDIPRRLDEIALADYLVVLEEDTQRTFYEGIVRLPPAHTLSLDRHGKTTLRQYWAPDPDRELRLGSDEEYRQAFRAQITRAVECRLRSAKPTSVMLSGGLDSSSIACLAARALAGRGERLTAVCSVLPENFQGPEQDEWEYIREVAAQEPNIDLHRVTAEGAGLFSGLEQVFAINDGPCRDLFHYMTRALLETANARGAGNLLWGFGGDHVVSRSATGYLSELARHGQLITLLRELQGRRRISHKPLVSLLKSELVSPLLPSTILKAYRRLKGRPPRNEYIARSAIHPEFARQSGLEDRLRTLGVERETTRFTSVRAGQYKAITTGGNSAAMEYAAHLGAALGIRLHTPLFDKRLLEHCLSLPVEQKARDGWTRWTLRSGMEGVLPARIQWRRDKLPFSPDFHQRVRKDLELLEALLENVESDAELRKYLDTARIRRTLEAWPQHQVEFSQYAESLAVVGISLVVARFLQWSRQYFQEQ